MKWNAFKVDVGHGVACTQGGRAYRTHNFTRRPTFKRVAGGSEVHVGQSPGNGRVLRRALGSVQGLLVAFAEFLIGSIHGFSRGCAWSFGGRGIQRKWPPRMKSVVVR